MILRGDSDKYEYLGENETKFETILTHWSIDKAGSNDEKKSRWIVPFKNRKTNYVKKTLIKTSE